MEKKMLQLIEKMYIDIQNIKSVMPNMATKEDLTRMATKEDLTRMATKEDLTRMATKEDLTRMATKEDLTRMATKDDLFKVERSLKYDIVRLENEMNQNHKALYDGYRLVYDKLEILDKKVHKIGEIVDRHDVEIAVLRSTGA